MRAELLSLEALQKAALSHEAGARRRMAAGQRARAAARASRRLLEVESGWERAVETALGDYLEAVCVERLDEIAGALGDLDERAAGAHRGRGEPQRCDPGRARGRPPAAQGHRAGALTVAARRTSITADSLAEALQRRATLPAGPVDHHARGRMGRAATGCASAAATDHHAGVIEREHRLKALRARLRRRWKRRRAASRRISTACASRSARPKPSATACSPASRARIASTRTCSGSSKPCARARRNPRFAASGWKKRRRRSSREMGVHAGSARASRGELDQRPCSARRARLAPAGSGERARRASRERRCRARAARRQRRWPRGIC